MSRVYNILTIVLLVLAVGAVAFIGLRFLQPPAVTPTPLAALPTLVELPTITPTETPSPTLTPSLTPTLTPTSTATFTPTATFTLPTVPPTITLTPSLTPSLTPTETPIPSIEPSATITDTLEPTLTPDVTASFTPTATLIAITQQPLPPTPSPFPFTLRDQIVFTQNFTNTAGCLWQGIGGRVFDSNGSDLQGIRVHVFGNGIDAFAVSGSNTLYGPSGWEIQLANTVSASTFIVELQTPTGTLVSPQIQVTFPADCARNVALVNFVQTRPF